MTDLRSFIKEKNNTLSWSGEWSRIWVKPDIFSAQEYIVGAIASDDKESLHDFRVLTGADRFACIYGEDSKSFFEETLNELRVGLRQARHEKTLINNINFSDKFRIEKVGTLRTQMPGESLERMLIDGTIPLEPEEPKGKKSRFKTKAAEEVVKSVIEKVKIKDFFAASSFIKEDHFGSESNYVEVNLVTNKSAGIIASGWYSSPERIQFEFLNAASKVETYASATKRKHPAVFFCRPTSSDGLTKAKWAEVQESLKKLQWRLETKGAKVITHEDTDYLADKVIEWTKTAA